MFDIVHKGVVDKEINIGIGVATTGGSQLVEDWLKKKQEDIQKRLEDKVKKLLESRKKFEQTNTTTDNSK